MKKCIFTLMTICGTFYSSGQITLTESNTPRSSNYQETRVANQQGIPVPEEGEDLIFDFSSLPQTTGTRTYEYFEPTRNGFTDFTRYELGGMDLLGEILTTEFYIDVDATGGFKVGRYLFPKTINLAQLTGSPNDSIHFEGGTYMVSSPTPILPFPFTYGNSAQAEIRESTDFELTVAAFGLDQTPGEMIQDYSVSIEATSYGKLILPVDDGQSIPYDVLVVKYQEQYIDSVMLGGAPAPGPIMDAFGRVQGDTSSIRFYKFYAEDLESTLLTIRMDETWTNAIEATYNPDFLTKDQGAGVTKNSLAGNLNIFPNPATDQLTISNDLNDIKIKDVLILDLSGKIIKQIEVSNSEVNSKKVQVDLKGFSDGVYFVKVNSNVESTTKKFIINR